MLKTSTLEPLIKQIVNQITEQSVCLNKPLPPESKKQNRYESILESISQLRGRPLFYPYLSSGLGHGPFVQLADGSVKLDFICGIGVHILGHSHPEVIRASLKGALEDAVMQGNLQMSLIYKDVLEKLIQIASRKSRLIQAWISPSGSMANENAIKIIRQKKQASRKILAFDRAFAGRTTMTCEITDNPAFKKGLPSYNEVLRVPFCPQNPEKALEVLKQHYDREKNNIAFFIMELMQGDGGFFRAPPEFFIPLMDFCKKHGIAIWLDEIQTFCRSGEFFAFEKLGLGDYVDVCTIGKTLQLSAVLWTKEYNPEPGLVSGTFASSSSSYYVALSTLNILESYMGPHGKIAEIEKNWLSRLQDLEKESLVSKIEGWGLMWGVTPCGLVNQIPQLLQALFEQGLIVFSCGAGQNKRLRFLLPAILENQHLDQAIAILRKTLLDFKQ